eukprot:1153435-Pelagomonas_calceolata.AAC.4
MAIIEGIMKKGKGLPQLGTWQKPMGSGGVYLYVRARVDACVCACVREYFSAWEWTAVGRM